MSRGNDPARKPPPLLTRRKQAPDARHNLAQPGRAGKTQTLNRPSAVGAPPNWQPESGTTISTAGSALNRNEFAYSRETVGTV